MSKLKMCWYTAGDQLLCRWVDSQELAMCPEGSIPLEGGEERSSGATSGAGIQAREFADKAA
jgi:hypothetical protein